MSLAEELKTLADESKKAQEADPKFVAKGLLKDVRAMCSTAAAAGLYSVTYDCRVGDWRRVLERLSELLERDGFSSIVAGSDITITWNNPTKGKKEKDEKEVAIA